MQRECYSELTHARSPQDPYVSVGCEPDGELLPYVDPVASPLCRLAQGLDMNIPKIWNLIQDRWDDWAFRHRIVVVVDVVIVDMNQISPNNVHIATANLKVAQHLATAWSEGGDGAIRGG